MSRPTIRPKAVCVCRDGHRILVERGHDRVTQERFYRAIGGAIEFGERAADAVRREWLEEVRAELDDLQLLGVLENLFTFEGREGHELVFVFSARLRGASLRSDVPVELVEPGGQRHVIEWVSVAELESHGVAIYPDGLLGLLGDEGDEGG